MYYTQKGIVLKKDYWRKIKEEMQKEEKMIKKWIEKEKKQIRKWCKKNIL